MDKREREDKGNWTTMLHGFQIFCFYFFSFWLWVCLANVLLRFINIALLCIQENAADRPTIYDVILMFNKETALLPSPNNQRFHLLEVWRILVHLI